MSAIYTELAARSFVLLARGRWLTCRSLSAPRPARRNPCNAGYAEYQGTGLSRPSRALTSTGAYIDATAADGQIGAGAIGTVPSPRANAAFANVTDWLAIEFDRDASAISEVVAHAYYGVAVLEQARGVRFFPTP